MSPSFDDRPGHEYDDERNWYRPGKDEPKESDGNDGAERAEESAPPVADKKSLSDDELSAAEGDAKAKKEADDKTEDPAGEGEGLYKPSQKKKKGRGRGITRKQGGVIGFIVALIVGAIMGLASQAPGLVVGHLREMLLDRVGQTQMFQSRKYRQTKLSKLKNLFSTDGRRGQKIIAEMESKGYKFHFDPNDKSKIIGLTHPDGTKGLVGTGIGEEIDGFIEKQHPFRSARWKTKRMNAFYNKFKVKRSSPIGKEKLEEDKKADPKRTVNKEMADDVIGEESSIKSAHATADEDGGNQEEVDNQNNVGNAADEAGDEIGQEMSEISEKLKAGDSIEDIDSIFGDSVDSIEEGTNPKLIGVMKGLSEGSIGGKIFGKVKGFLNPTDILDTVCTLRNRIRLAQAAARTIRAIRLLRYAAVFIKAGDDARRGNASMKLMNELMKRVMSEDTNGNSFGSSAGFSFLQNGTFSKKQNDATRNKIGVDGKVNGFVAGIKKVTDTFPGMGKCWVWQSPVFQAGVMVGQVVVTVIGCIFTGCAASGATQAVGQTTTKLVVAELKNAIKKIITKKLLKDAAIGAAVGFGIQAAMAYLQTYIQKTLLLSFTGQEKGGQLGDILTGGAGTMNKNRSAEAGMVPATTTQYAAVLKDYYAWDKEQKSKESFFARTFDIHNPHSLAFNSISAMIGTGSGGVTTTVSNIAQAGTSLLSGGLITKFASVLGGTLHADDGDNIAFDDYTLEGGDWDGTKIATDLAGNPQYIMRSDISAIDNEDNIRELTESGDIDPDTLEPKSTAFKEYVQDCVDDPDTFSQLEFHSKDCMATKDKTKHFAAHLAYLDMMDGIDAEFDPSSLDSGGSSSSSATAPTGGATGPVDISQTSEIPGAPGFRLATAVLPQFENMINAAKQDGVELLPLSSAWRDPQKQIELRKQNCPDWQNSEPNDCHPPTAKPGTSNHEGGRAVDFANMCYPSGTTCPGNARWEWLRAHAAEYGFYPLATEAWHWSTTGK